MNVLNLHAELQSNPKGIAIYRKLAQEYQRLGMENESKAFLELIRRKFNDNNSNADQEQRKNNKENN